MNYYSTIMLISILILLVFGTIILSNKNIERRVRRGLFSICFLAIVGSICEWIGESINGIKFFQEYNFDIELHILVKFIELSIIPIIPVICTEYVFKSEEHKRKVSKVIFVFLIIHLGLELCSIFFKGFVFSVNEKNELVRSQLYPVYIIIFICAVFYMIVKIFKFSRSYQNANIVQLCSLVFFMLIGILIDISDMLIKMTWLCITMSIIFSYMYYNGLIQYVDGLTKLLNQKSYTSYFETNTNTEFTLGIFDLNDFKLINDKLGHSFGDDVLIMVSNIIRKQYGKYGKCYRIGGDEFAVIIEDKKSNINISKLNREFSRRLEKERINMPNLPHVSYGFASYNPKRKNIQNVFDVKELADKRMYDHKKVSKN